MDGVTRVFSKFQRGIRWNRIKFFVSHNDVLAIYKFYSCSCSNNCFKYTISILPLSESKLYLGKINPMRKCSFNVTPLQLTCMHAF